jgi:hypothetical protein
MNLQNVGIVVALITGLGTMGAGAWKFITWAQDINRVVAEQSTIRKDLDDLKRQLYQASELTSRRLEIITAQNSNGDRRAKITAADLTGEWDLKFHDSGNQSAKISVSALSSTQFEFRGKLPQQSQPALKTEGRGTIAGMQVRAEFKTWTDDGKHWEGEAEFIVQGKDYLRGWYRDGQGIYDTIDAKRSP